VESWKACLANKQLGAIPEPQNPYVALVESLEREVILREFLPKLSSKASYELDSHQFCQGFVSKLQIKLKQENLNKLIEDILTENISKALEIRWVDLLGCQERCPLCHSKCSLKDDHHEQHHTNIHYLAAFAATRRTAKKGIWLHNCHSKESIQNSWMWYDGNNYNTFDEVIDKFLPSWRQNFPKVHEENRMSSYVPDKIKKCWLGVKDVLLMRQRLTLDIVDETPVEWEDLLPVSKRLKIEQVDNIFDY